MSKGRLSSMPERILMTADASGCVWLYAVDLIRALGDFGIEVHLATFGAPLSALQRETVGQMRHLVVHESTFRLEWMEEPWQDVRASGEWLLRLEKDLRPDLLHLNGFCHAQLPWSCPKLVVAHSDVFSWFSAVHGRVPGQEWGRYQYEVTQGLRAADEIVAPTRSVLEQLRLFYGPLQRGRVVPNARDTKSLSPEGMNIEKEPVVLSVGSIRDEARNLTALAQVTDSVSARGWSVIVAGRDLEPPDLTRHFKRASIFADPAKYEPFGLSILEAAISGSALVLGDLPSLRENWEGSAVFVDPGSVEQLRAVLLRLIDRPDERLEFARRARDRARFFDVRTMASAYAEIYADLVVPSLSPARGHLMAQKRSAGSKA